MNLLNILLSNPVQESGEVVNILWSCPYVSDVISRNSLSKNNLVSQMLNRKNICWPKGRLYLKTNNKNNIAVITYELKILKLI